MEYKNFSPECVQNAIIIGYCKTPFKKWRRFPLFRQNLNYLSFFPKMEKCT